RDRRTCSSRASSRPGIAPREHLARSGRRLLLLGPGNQQRYQDRRIIAQTPQWSRRREGRKTDRRGSPYRWRTTSWQRWKPEPADDGDSSTEVTYPPTNSIFRMTPSPSYSIVPSPNSSSGKLSRSRRYDGFGAGPLSRIRPTSEMCIPTRMRLELSDPLLEPFMTVSLTAQTATAIRKNTATSTRGDPSNRSHGPSICWPWRDCACSRGRAAAARSGEPAGGRNVNRRAPPHVGQVVSLSVSERYAQDGQTFAMIGP